MNIRELTPDDLEIMLGIVASHKDNSTPIEPTRKQFIKELSELGTNRFIYGAFIDDKPAAMIQLILNNADNDPELANGADIAHVHNLQVLKELEGKGIGGRMMVFVEELAKTMGKVTLTLGVDDWNERAIGLYKKLGYKVFKEVPGRTPDEKGLVMRKSL